MSINTAGLRRTALTLHAMPPRDRDWLLSQLEPDEREAVRALLDELAALGIPADANLLEQALRQQPGGEGGDPRRPQDGAAGQAEQALVLADPARLAQALQHEPELLVARLLYLREWPWQARMLAQYPAPRRQLIVAGLRQLQGQPQVGAGAGRLAASLMTAVYQRLQSQQPAAAGAQLAAAAGGRWSGLWRRSGGRNRG